MSVYARATFFFILAGSIALIYLRGGEQTVLKWGLSAPDASLIGSLSRKITLP